MLNCPQFSVISYLNNIDIQMNRGSGTGVTCTIDTKPACVAVTISHSVFHSAFYTSTTVSLLYSCFQVPSKSYRRNMIACCFIISNKQCQKRCGKCKKGNWDSHRAPFYYPSLNSFFSSTVTLFSAVLCNSYVTEQMQ